MAKGSPNIFWSAAEDGIVRQFDARCPTEDQRDYQSGNALVMLENHGAVVEVKVSRD